MTGIASIGASLALTGPEEAYARQLLAALELSLEDTGGLVDLIVVDDKSDAGAARCAAERLADSPAIAVVGPMNSWTCGVQGPIFAAAGLAHVTPSASNPALALHGWRTFFRACPSDKRQAGALAWVAKHLAAADRVASVHDDTSFAAPLSDAFVAESRSLGLEVTAVAAADGSSGERARLAALVAGLPQAVLVAGLEEACARAAGVLRDVGSTAILLGTDAVKPTHVLRKDGTPAPYLTNSAADARRQAPELHERLTARLGRHDSVYTIETYDVARHLATILIAQPTLTRAELLELLRQPFEGLGGRYAFDARGERPDAAVAVYRDDAEGLKYLGTAAELQTAAAAVSPTRRSL